MSAFIYKNRFLIGTLAFAAVIFAVILGVFSVDDATNRMIVEYATNLGWQIDPSPIEISHLALPKTFDSVYEAYNALQKASGFDLEEFKGKTAVRYTYKVKNHKESSRGDVIMNILVYEKRIIAGDISSRDSGGFMHGITEISKITT